MKKRLTAFLLIICAMAAVFCPVPTVSASGLYQLGDADLNGEVTAADARIALRQSVGLEKYVAGSREYRLMDMNGDEQITAADARTILRTAVKLVNPAYCDFSEETDEEALTDVNEYEILRSGTFYLKGKIVDSSGTSDVEMAVTPSSAYMLTDLDSAELAIMISEGKYYIIYPAEKKYLKLSTSAMSLIGLDEDDFTDLAELGFSDLKPLSQAQTVIAVSINGEVYKKYALKQNDGTRYNVYMDGNELIALEDISEGKVVSSIYVDSISEDIPENMLKIPSSYEKVGILQFVDLISDLA